MSLHNFEVHISVFMLQSLQSSLKALNIKILFSKLSIMFSAKLSSFSLDSCIQGFRKPKGKPIYAG